VRRLLRQTAGETPLVPRGKPARQEESGSLVGQTTASVGMTALETRRRAAFNALRAAREHEAPAGRRRYQRKALGCGAAHGARAKGKIRTLRRVREGCGARQEGFFASLKMTTFGREPTPGGKGCRASRYKASRRRRSERPGATFKPTTTETCETCYLPLASRYSPITTHQSLRHHSRVTVLTGRGRGNFPSRWGNRRASGNGRGLRFRGFCRRKF